MAAKDRYFMKLQTKYSKDIRIVRVYPFSVDRIIKANQTGLLSSILTEKELPLPEFFLS